MDYRPWIYSRLSSARDEIETSEKKTETKGEKETREQNSSCSVLLGDQRRWLLARETEIKSLDVKDKKGPSSNVHLHSVSFYLNLCVFAEEVWGVDTLHACGGTVVSARSVFVHQGVTVCVWLSREDVRRGCSPTYLRPWFIAHCMPSECVWVCEWTFAPLPSSVNSHFINFVALCNHVEEKH